MNEMPRLTQKSFPLLYKQYQMTGFIGDTTDQ